MEDRRHGDRALLAASPSLTSLSLRDTPITDAGLVHLAKLTKLRDLDPRP